MIDSTKAQLRSFSFSTHISAEPFTTSPQVYVVQHANSQYDYVATGSFVFDTSDGKTPRILLLQRSAHDSMPNLWEIPGGACDDEDITILHAAARELWEETGLKATTIGPAVGKPQLFSSRSGKKICKFNFMVHAATSPEGQLQVKLDPEEHQHFVYASEDEVKRRKTGDVELHFTTSEVEKAVLESFRHIKQG